MKRKELPKYLFNNISIVEPYPEFVAPIASMINITAFFPGGNGLWVEEDSEVFPSILILGQDFSTEKQYIKMLQEVANDLNGPTWRNLRKLFDEASVNLYDCFFSNVFMGLRKTDSMTGKFPGFKDKEFVNRNLDFLTLQIETIHPRLIITLGKYSAELLSYLSDDLICWKNGNALQQPDIGLIKEVHFNKHACACIALEHPSMRNSNVHRRIYKELVGNEAEVRMLKDALN